MTCFGLAVFSIAKWDEAAALQRALEEETAAKKAAAAELIEEAETAVEIGSEQASD